METRPDPTVLSPSRLLYPEHVPIPDCRDSTYLLTGVATPSHLGLRVSFHPCLYVHKSSMSQVRTTTRPVIPKFYWFSLIGTTTPHQENPIYLWFTLSNVRQFINRISWLGSLGYGRGFSMVVDDPLTPGLLPRSDCKSISTSSFTILCLISGQKVQPSDFLCHWFTVSSTPSLIESRLNNYPLLILKQQRRPVY